MPRYANPYQAQTPVGQGMQSIAAALMSGPSAGEKAKIDLDRSRFENERLTRTGNQAIADLFEQSQMLAGQTAGDFTPAEDTGLQRVLQGIPLAAAKYAAPAGGLDPQQARGIYAALSQYGGEDMLRRALPTIGSVPGRDTALTVGRAEDLREASVADAIAKAMGSNVVQVADPTSPTGAVYESRGGAVSRNAPAIRTGGGSTRLPLDISPRDQEGLQSMIEAAAGVRYTAAGEVDPEGAPPIAPEAMNRLLTRTSELYQHTRNAQTAADQALREMGGLTETGEEDTNWLWGLGEDTRQQELGVQPPAAGGAMSALPDAASNTGRVVRDTQTNERLVSDGVNWIPAGT